MAGSVSYQNLFCTHVALKGAEISTSFSSISAERRARLMGRRHWMKLSAATIIYDLNELSCRFLRLCGPMILYEIYYPNFLKNCLFGGSMVSYTSFPFFHPELERMKLAGVNVDYFFKIDSKLN